MSEFTQFDAIAPVVIPAKEEVVYDKYWLECMVIRAPHPSRDATLVAKFKLYNNITREFAPSGEGINIEIPAVFAKAMEDVDFATSMEYVFRALKVELDAKLAEIAEMANATTTTTTTEVGE